MPCPFLKICDEEVSYGHYSDYCADSFHCVRCKRYEEYSKKKMKPRNWEKFLSGKFQIEYNTTEDDFLVKP